MLDALTLGQLRSFVAVVECGSFRSGAAHLSRAQSAISHAIANLEAELDVRLFDRAGHRAIMTPEGLALLEHARDILLRVDALRARSRGFGEGEELELSISVDTLFPAAQIGEALVEMRAAHPSVSIRMAVEPLGGPITALIEKRSTLAVIIGGTFRDPSVTLEALSSVETVAVVATQHPLAMLSRPVNETDLADHLQIVLSDPTTRSEGRDFGVLSPYTCRVNNQDTKLELIRSGLGWGSLPLWQVARDLAKGRLVRVGTKALGRSAQIETEAYLAHRIDAPPGPAGRAFSKALARIAARS